jgi:hypothetical protein
MLSVAIHMPSASGASPNVSENGDVFPTEKIGDDNHLTNGFGLNLTSDKDIPLASLSTARCGFGITSTNDTIYALGIFSMNSNNFFLLNFVFRWI